METGFRKWGWRWVCAFSFLCLCAMPAVSQDCNGTYEKGLALLNKKTEANVKEAIRQFESAKRCYKVNRDQTAMLQSKPRPDGYSKLRRTDSGL